MSRRIINILGQLTKKNGKTFLNFAEYQKSLPNSRSKPLDVLSQQIVNSIPEKILSKKSVRIGKSMIKKKGGFLRAKSELDEVYAFLKKVFDFFAQLC